MMSQLKKRLKKCERCEKKTQQTNTSEGYAGVVYYQDWTCECGKINSFRLNPTQPLTEFTVSY